VSDVTIVMAARNEERHVERALRSCRAQTIPCDLILIDDCSSDKTAELAAGGGAHLIQNREHCGLPASLNRGIRAANTRYVVRVDADDYVAPEFAEILAMHLDLNPSMEAVACDYYTVDEHEAHIAHHAADENPIGCGIMFRKDRLVEIGLYDEAFLLWEDRELRSRFSWPVHRVALPLYRYRRHPGSMTMGHEDPFWRRLQETNFATDSHGFFIANDARENAA
jgi:glycosyltransferase involved in cell wall biosynthesis